MGNLHSDSEPQEQPTTSSGLKRILRSALPSSASELRHLLHQYPEIVPAVEGFASKLGLHLDEKRAGYVLYENVLIHLAPALKAFGDKPVIELLQAVLGGVPSPQRFFDFCKKGLPRIQAVAADDGGRTFSELASLMPDIFEQRPFAAPRRIAHHFLTNDLELIARAVKERGARQVRSELQEIALRQKSSSYVNLSELAARISISPDTTTRSHLMVSVSWYVSCMRAGLSQRGFIGFTSNVAGRLQTLETVADLPTIESVAEEVLNRGLYESAFTGFLYENTPCLTAVAARIGGPALVSLLRAAIPHLPHDRRDDNEAQLLQSRFLSSFLQQVIEPLSCCDCAVHSDTISMHLEVLFRSTQEALLEQVQKGGEVFTRDGTLAHQVFLSDTAFAVSLLRHVASLDVASIKAVFDSTAAISKALIAHHPELDHRKIYSVLFGAPLLESMSQVHEFLELLAPIQNSGVVIAVLAQIADRGMLEDRAELFDLTASLVENYTNFSSGADAAFESVLLAALQNGLISESSSLVRLCEELCELSFGTGERSAAYFRFALAPFITSNHVQEADEISAIGHTLLSWKIPNGDFWEEFDRALVNSRTRNGAIALLPELAMKYVLEFRESAQQSNRPWRKIDTTCITSRPEYLGSLVNFLSLRNIDSFDILMLLRSEKTDRLIQAVDLVRSLNRLGTAIPNPTHFKNGAAYHSELERRLNQSLAFLFESATDDRRWPTVISRAGPDLAVDTALRVVNGEISDPVRYLEALNHIGPDWRRFRYDRQASRALERVSAEELRIWTENSSSLVLYELSDQERVWRALRTFMVELRSESRSIGLSFSIPSLQSLHERIEELEKKPLQQRSKRSQRKLSDLQQRANLVQEGLFLFYALDNHELLPMALPKAERLTRVSEASNILVNSRASSELSEAINDEYAEANDPLCFRWSDDPIQLLGEAPNFLEFPLVRLAQAVPYETAAEVSFEHGVSDMLVSELAGLLQRSLADPELQITSVISLPPKSWMVKGTRSYGTEIDTFTWTMTFDPGSRRMRFREAGVAGARDKVTVLAREHEHKEGVVRLLAPSNRSLGSAVVMYVPTTNGKILASTVGGIGERLHDVAVDFIATRAQELNARAELIPLR